MLSQTTSTRSRWSNFKLSSTPVKLIAIALFFVLAVNVSLIVYLNREQVTDYLYVAKTVVTHPAPLITVTLTPVAVTQDVTQDVVQNVVAPTKPTKHIERMLGTRPPRIETKVDSSHVSTTPVYPIMGSSVWRDPAKDTCGKQFGNGFQEVKICKSSGFSCHYNPEIVATNCVVNSLVIHPSKITVSRGNETIESVRWREESPEFPVYSPGAFSVGCEADSSAKSDIRRGNDMYRDHLAPMLSSFDYGKQNQQCDVTIDQAVLLTRYEYANLYHTMTDLYNTFQAANMLGKPTYSPSDLTVIFLDGHSQGAMDDYWETLFTPNIRYIKQFPDGADNICIKHAVFVSPGYGSALSPGMFKYDTMSCSNHPCMNDFAKFVQTKFRLDEPFTMTTRDAFDNEVVIDSTSTVPLISFTARRPYLSHPRVRMDATERVLVDEKDSMEAISTHLAKSARFYAWDFTRMSLRDQLRVLYASRIVMGVHGAALSHILYMKPQTALVELVPQEYSSRTHFKFFAAWSGHQYVPLGIKTAQYPGYSLDVPEIEAACRKILAES